MLSPFNLPELSRGRIWMAFAAALMADGIQIALGPLGWTFLDEIIDLGMMIIAVFLLGFHPLLLPTFLIELVPVVDMLPTWTGCVGAVVFLRRRQKKSEPSPSPDVEGDVIDV